MQIYQGFQRNHTKNVATLVKECQDVCRMAAQIFIGLLKILKTKRMIKANVVGKALTFTILLLTISLILSGYLCNNLKKMYKKYDTERREHILSQNKNELHIDRFRKQLHSDGCQIENLQLVNSNYDSVHLSNLLTSKKLIYRYPEKSCSACTQIDIERIKEISKKIGKEEILIISNFNELRSFTEFNKTMSLYAQCYNYQYDFGLAVESNTDFRVDPFFFVLDKDLTTMLLFYAGDYPELGEIYLNRISDLFK